MLVEYRKSGKCCQISHGMISIHLSKIPCSLTVIANQRMKFFRAVNSNRLKRNNHSNSQFIINRCRDDGGKKEINFLPVFIEYRNIFDRLKQFRNFLYYTQHVPDN